MSGSSQPLPSGSSSGSRSAGLGRLILLATSSSVAVLPCASGCTRTVLVPESSPVRIGPDARARVYALVGGEWVVSDNSVDLEEGWYLVPPSYVER